MGKMRGDTFKEVDGEVRRRERRRGRRIRLAAVLLGVAACEGDAGPMGPEGPEGPPGPGTRVTFVTQLDAEGAGAVHLPTEAGTPQNPPAVSCYMAETQDSEVWLVMATDDIFGGCGIRQHNTHLDVAFVFGPPNWFLRVVAVY